MSRAIELVNEPAHLRGLAMAGWVAAGTLRPAEEQSERIDFETLFNRDNHFVLKVMGESMIDAAICDGDYVVVREQQTAENGDIVAAMLNDEATVKVFKQRDGKTWLLPRNSAYEPIDGDYAKVLGKVVAVIRSVS